MALPTSGPISLSQIQTEFGGTNPISLSEYYRGGGLVTANNTDVPASGPLPMSAFLGAAKSVPGSHSDTTTGTSNFTLPVFSSLTITVRGAGGGGGGSTYDVGAAGSNGANGGQSNVKVGASTIMSGNGGGGGAGSYYDFPPKGANGGASGGDTNTAGGGAAGGTGGTYGASKGGDGGNGGRAVRAFSPGENTNIEPGKVISITVGAGGNGGAGQVSGARGSNGSVVLSWT